MLKQKILLLPAYFFPGPVIAVAHEVFSVTKVVIGCGRCSRWGGSTLEHNSALCVLKPFLWLVILPWLTWKSQRGGYLHLGISNNHLPSSLPPPPGLLMLLFMHR